MHKGVFFEKMYVPLPWTDFCQQTQLSYPIASALGGRPTISIERMQRSHCLQSLFEQADPGAEEALHD